MEKLKDNEIEKQTIYHEMISINSYGFSNFLKHINYDYKMLYNVLDKLYKSKYISETEKRKIIKIKTEAKNKEKKLAKKIIKK
jgi:uncharacterized protein YqgQ